MDDTATWPDHSPALFQAGTWPSVEDAHEHALVLLAMGIECSVHVMSGGYGLFTLGADAQAAQRELETYQQEQPMRVITTPSTVGDHPFGITWFAMWVLISAIVFGWQLIDPTITGRFSNSTNGFLEQGDWWRPFTSLFLHGDLPHLLGNILIGGIFCLAVSKLLGAWRAWPLILLGGALGNLVNLLFHRNEPFSSIGASSATFSALGILVGLAFTAEPTTNRRQMALSFALPFISGLLLFSLFGTGGENTDVGAHVWGGLCGLALGVLPRICKRTPNKPRDSGTLTLGPYSRSQWLG